MTLFLQAVGKPAREAEHSPICGAIVLMLPEFWHVPNKVILNSTDVEPPFTWEVSLVRGFLGNLSNWFWQRRMAYIILLQMILLLKHRNTILLSLKWSKYKYILRVGKWSPFLFLSSERCLGQLLLNNTLLVKHISLKDNLLQIMWLRWVY